MVSVRVLDLAERITTLVEANVWTCTNFPTRNDLQQRLAAGRENLAAAFRLLVDRGVLAIYLDREVSSRPRYLPVDDSAQHACGSAVDYVETSIEHRITSGVWNAANFPSLKAMATELHCRAHTVSAALRRLEARGVVRMVKVTRTWRWVPMSHPAFPRPELHYTFADSIRAGLWTGPLPDPVDLARHYHVHRAKMMTALRLLERHELVRYVWLPDFTSRVWYVMDAQTPQWLLPATGTKAAAIAADLVRRLPEWLIVGRDGAIIQRRPLPPITLLRQHYHCPYSVMRTALTALVMRGVLERVEYAQPKYLPLRVPARAFPEGIPAASRRAGIARRRRPVKRSPPLPPAAKVS